MLELLAPAGSMEALHAAVQSGANAVYLGCGSFNARQSAKNFTPQTLTEAVKYCHIRGVQVHLTVNTLVSDKEMAELSELLCHAARSGVDAFIVQDLGVVELCRQIAPQIPIHGSTQMSIHSLPGVLLCAGWGLSRVVLSRELSREEIRYITANSPIEIEVFAHGALCMGYSGQCYLSAAIGGRSGNRGRCAQPCRQCYGYGRYQNKYPLSLKDNCLVQYMKDLEMMGVASVKLEGRMKRPEYVAAVTGTYRQAIDKGVVTPQMMSTLHAAFNRQGFTDGYFQGRIGGEMFGTRQDKDDPAFMKQMRSAYEGAENPLVPITFHATVTAGRSTLTVTDPEGRKCTVEGPAPEQARNAPLSAESLASRLQKTGGTPYYCTDIQVDIIPGVTMSAAHINGLRRDVLNMLTAQRARRDPVAPGRMKKPSMFPGNRYHPVLTVQITSAEQITGRLLKMNPGVLYVPIHILKDDLVLCKMLTDRLTVCAVLPRIAHDGELADLQRAMKEIRRQGVSQVLVGNLGHIIPARECGMDIRGDFGLNLYNSTAMNMARQLELISATVSFEMTLAQIRDVSKAVPAEMLCYGRLPLMVTENCMIRGAAGQCSCHLGPAKLADKTGAQFPVIRDGTSCRNVLLNSMKLNMLDRQNDLNRLGLWATRLYFTTENPKEVDQVLASYQNPAPFDPGTSTRGLYLRGVE
mgnify:CR=1 FL=1